MRIPLSEEELGYVYCLSTYCSFVPEFWWSAKYYNKQRKMTFAEFKKQYPIQCGWNSRYRTNEKRRIYR